MLQEIRITSNNWLKPQCLRPLALLRKLTYLSLRGCHNLKCYIFYLRVTSITDFECLQVS